MNDRRAGWLCLALGVLLGSQLWALYGKRPGDARFEPARATVVPSLEVFGATDLSQSFLVHADGLEAITVHARAAGGPPAGQAILSLSSVDLPVPVTARVAAVELVASSSFTWRLPRIASAAGRRFVLNIRLPDAARGQGVSFDVGAPEYADGDLLVGGRVQWGDLRFRARSRRARTIDLLHGLPAPFDREVVIVGLCVLLDVALVGLATAIISTAPEPG